MEHPPEWTQEEMQELENKIREHRKFSLAEAIGRLGGGDLMKGASPVTAKRRAELVIEDYLEKHLRDAEGALEVVLLRRAATSQTLMEVGYDQPLVGLGKYCREVMLSESRLRDLVRDVDAQWGRIYLERPKFDVPGRPPADDDPYTLESVTKQLEQLLGTLTGDKDD
ncbi:hypothetical protein [Aeoliella mucimassa]|uniref:Uncharacterized protein n=1 Tax=Aeoliella mucimassa TaxID=2527972 RepID=A0A518ASN6_9BACT|nr:hypothetical protein [Aeoliella mucimassa]QDU57731.1 hypothetical protein Pan181_39530 [Aeoliella mucimassa]